MTSNAQHKAAVKTVVADLLPEPTTVQYWSIMFTIVLVFLLHIVFYYWLTNQIVGTALSVGWIAVYYAMLMAYLPITYRILRWCVLTIYPIDFEKVFTAYRKELAKEE